ARINIGPIPYLYDNQIRVFEVATHKELCRLKICADEPPDAHAWPDPFAFSPEGLTLIGAITSGYQHWDANVWFWDIPYGGERGKSRRLAGHFAKVNCMAPSLDGKTLVTGSKDSTLLVWGSSEFPESWWAIEKEPDPEE